MKVFLSILFLVFVVGISAQSVKISAQQINTISSKCPAPNQRDYSSVRADVQGNITYYPCPTTGTNIFSGISNFSNSTIDVPFRLLDRTFVNPQGHTTLFSLASTTPYTINNGGAGAHALEVDMTFTGVSAPAYGVYSRVNGITSEVGGLGWAPETVGVYSLATNLGETNINRILTGVQGTAYLRSPQAAIAIGGRFDAYSGGNQAALNPTPLYGIRASAFGGHNGTSPLTVAGDFNVSNLGGGGVGNLTEGIAVQARFDGGSPTTNYITAKGIALQGWGAASGGGVYTNSYGIYADTSIDRGAVNRYFIYSLSTSDSLFSGAVRGVLNPYAIGWDGSNKFTTENDVYDKIESIILSGNLSGTGSANLATYFTGLNTVAAMPLNYSSNRFIFYRTTTNDAFRGLIEPSTTGNGFVTLGDENDGTDLIYMDEANHKLDLLARTVRIGDGQGVNNGLSIELNDASNLITFFGNTGASTINMGNIWKHTFLRTLTAAGTTGAQTINKPLGSVNFAAGATSLVVTNNSASATSLIFLTAQTNDATCKSFSVTRAAGSFTINSNAACTGETAVAFQVTN